MRRFVAAAAMVTAGIAATGCRTRFFQASIHPYFEKAETPADVSGRWLAGGDEPDALLFSRAGGGEWRVTVLDRGDAPNPTAENRASVAVVRLGSVAGALYWDMTAEGGATGDLAKEHLLKLHSVARLRVDGDTMEIAFLDPQWMSEALGDGRVVLAHVLEANDDDGDGSIILTASTRELEEFLQTHGDAPGVFGEPELFHRVQ